MDSTFSEYSFDKVVSSVRDAKFYLEPDEEILNATAFSSAHGTTRDGDKSKVDANSATFALTNLPIETQLYRYRLILLGCNVGFFDWDLDDKVIIWNRESFRIFDCDVPEDGRGLNYDEAYSKVHEDDFSNIIATASDAVSTQVDRSAVKWSFYRVKRRDGTTGFVESAARLCVDPTTKKARLVGVNIDVTTRVELEHSRQEQLELRIKEQQQLQQRLHQFYDRIAHEVRNPCQGALSSLEVMRDLQGNSMKCLESLSVTSACDDTSRSKKLKEELDALRSSLKSMEESMNNIQECVNFQVQVLSDALHLSKLEANAVQFESQPFRIDAVASSSMSVHGGSISRTNTVNHGNVQLCFEVQDEAGNLVSADAYDDFFGSHKIASDPRHVKQILINLLGNAKKFTEKGKIVLQVRLMRQTADFLQWRFSVRDSGCGIDPVHLPKLFDRFRQVPGNYYSGSGLGLVICNQLLQLYDSNERLHVNTRVGVGSEFYFFLRLPKSVDTNDGIDSESLAVRRLSTSTAVNGQTVDEAHSAQDADCASSHEDRKVIAIVEDNVINLKVLDRLVRMIGYETMLFSDGEQIVEYMETKQPHLPRTQFTAIISDVVMPKMDGFSATRRIRQIDSAKDIPIIGLSGNAREEYKEMAMQCGMQAFLSKPTSKAVLASTLTQCLQESRRMQQDAQH